MNNPGRLESRQNRIILCAFIIVALFFCWPSGCGKCRFAGCRHRQTTQRQSIRPVLLNPARGRIIAADGRVLADSISQYDLVAHVSEMRQPGRPINTIKHILACERLLAMTIGRPSQLDEETVRRHLYRHPVMPLRFFDNLNASAGSCR